MQRMRTEKTSKGHEGKTALWQQVERGKKKASEATPVMCGVFEASGNKAGDGC